VDVRARFQRSKQEVFVAGRDRSGTILRDVADETNRSIFNGDELTPAQHDARMGVF
jgi:hypothetical protein